MDIGKRIKLRRKELNLSIDDLVKATGKNKATLYRYENGDIENMPLDILKPLASCLKVSVSYLIGEDEQNNDTNKKKAIISSSTLDKNDILSVIAKLQADDDFADMVFRLSKLDDEKISAVKQILTAFIK